MNSISASKALRCGAFSRLLMKKSFPFRVKAPTDWRGGGICDNVLANRDHYSGLAFGLGFFSPDGGTPQSVRMSEWCAPSMGANLWGGSPLWVVDPDLKRANRPRPIKPHSAPCSDASLETAEVRRGHSRVSVLHEIG